MTTIPLPNGRDLGGTPLAGGAKVRPGLLLRSAAPATADSAATVADLGISHVVDLRTDAEREAQPNHLPHGARTVVADVLADAAYAGAANLGRLAAQALGTHTVADGMGGRDLRAIMLESYRDFALLGSGRRAAAQVLGLLADPATGPVLIHCTAGKDRTGWVVSLVLQILGAPQDAITADYLASGPAVLEMFSGFTGQLPDPVQAARALAPVLGVERAYLDAGIEAATAQYGSMGAYLSDGLGVDDATLAGIRARLSTAADQSISASALM